MNQPPEGGAGTDVIGKQRVHGIADALAQIVADGAHTVEPDDHPVGLPAMCKHDVTGRRVSQKVGLRSVGSAG